MREGEKPRKMLPSLTFVIQSLIYLSFSQVRRGLLRVPWEARCTLP